MEYIVTAVSNPIFSILLVREFGIVGLGYGTVLSNLVTTVFLVIHFFQKKNAIKFKIHFSAKELGRIFAIGSTVSLAQIYLAVVDIAMNKIVILQFGENYLAAYAVINLVLNFGACYCCAIDAAGPFVSVAYGEKNTIVQRNVMSLATKSAFVLGLVFTVIEFAIAGVLPKLYGISDPEVYATAIYAGRVLAFMNIGMAFETELATYYPRVVQSILGNLYAIVYTLIAPLALAIPLSYICGFRGMIWGFFLTPYVTLLLGYVYVLVKHGKNMFPYIISESENKIFVHEIEVKEDEIDALNTTVGENLKSCNVSSSIITQLQLMIEETFMVIKEKTKTKGYWLTVL